MAPFVKFLQSSNVGLISRSRRVKITFRHWRNWFTVSSPTRLCCIPFPATIHNKLKCLQKYTGKWIIDLSDQHPKSTHNHTQVHCFKATILSVNRTFSLITRCVSPGQQQPNQTSETELICFQSESYISQPFYARMLFNENSMRRRYAPGSTKVPIHNMLGTTGTCSRASGIASSQTDFSGIFV